MRNHELKRWEIALIVISIFIFISSLSLYVAGFPLRKYIFGIDDDQSRSQIGQIAQKVGTLRRQLGGDLEFKSVGVMTPVFDQDTLVTGEEASASVQLEDGSTLELGPTTMVKLSYESQFSLEGIARAAKVKVLTGKVTGQAKQRKIIVQTKEKTVAIAKNMRETVSTIRRLPSVPQAEEPKAPPPPPPPPPVAVAPPQPVPVAQPTLTPTPTPVPQVVATPTPKPSPLPPAIAKIQFTSPPNGAKFQVPNGSVVAEKPIQFEWTVSPPAAKVLIKISKVNRSGDGKTELQEVFQDLVQANRGKASFRWVAKSPGEYQWGISGEQVERLPGFAKKRMSFKVNREFEAIETLEPLIGGQKLDTNLLRGRQLKNFAIVLRWKPYAQAENYRVWVAKESNSRTPLLQKTVGENEYVFNKDKVYSGRFVYKVSVDLPSGFTVTSKVRPFIFNFLPPILVVPGDKAVFSKQANLEKGTNILLTWQKTNFTDAYELEIGEDSDFTRIHFRKKMKQNYFIFDPLKPGKYWWRVRSYSKDVLSPPSAAFEVVVTP